MRMRGNYGAIPSSDPPPPRLSRAKATHTIPLEELTSSWRQDNEYILRGYRRDLGSYRLCFHSIYAYSHNETVNIWTHLVGSLAALTTLAVVVLTLAPSSVVVSDKRLDRKAPFALFNPFSPNVAWPDSLSFVIFLLSAATCLGFSSAFHTFSCHSKEIAHRWNRLDYIGIVVLISGTFVPLIRFGFFCEPWLQHLYLSLVGLASACTVAVVLAPHARTPEYRRFRTFVFIALGVSAVFPVGHGVARYGILAASDAFALPWVVLGGVLYVAGALLYAERFPERLSPGTFDIVGCSHQIFHVLILLAAWAHYAAIAESFRFWYGEMGGKCPVERYA